MPHHRPPLRLRMMHRNRRHYRDSRHALHDQSATRGSSLSPCIWIAVSPARFAKSQRVSSDFIHKDANLLDTLRQLLHNLPCRLHANAPRALLIKHEPYRIRSRIDRNERVLQIRHPTNLHPSHKTPVVYYETTGSDPLRRNLPTQQPRQLGRSPGSRLASATRRSETRDTQPSQPRRDPRENEFHSPPRALHSSGIFSASPNATPRSTLNVFRSREFTPIKSQPASSARSNSSSSCTSQRTSSPARSRRVSITSSILPPTAPRQSAIPHPPNSPALRLTEIHPR